MSLSYIIPTIDLDLICFMLVLIALFLGDNRNYMQMVQDSIISLLLTYTICSNHNIICTLTIPS